MALDTQQPPRRSARPRMSLNGTGSGGLQLGGSSMTTKPIGLGGTATSDSKENKKEDAFRLAKKKRAASVAGTELQTLLKETQNQINPTAPTSRRNAPGPRKSAIRAVPQIFQSPTGLIPSPHTRQGLSFKPLIASPPKAQKAIAAPVEPPVSTRDATQTIATFGQHDPTLTLNDPASSRGCATQIILPKRRVTFSKRQEKTEFARDEPTLNLGTLRREEPATPSTTQGSSSVGRSFAHSDSDSDSDSDPDSDMSTDASAFNMATTSDMMLTGSSFANASSDMDMSLDRSIDGTAAEHGDDATKSMEITAAHGQIRKRKASGLTTMDDSESEVDDSLDAAGEVDPTFEDRSRAMDFTEAVGGVPLLKRRRSSVAQLAADRAVLMDNEQVDDITASRAGITFTHAASDESSVSFDAADGEDRSEMMDFTTPMGAGSGAWGEADAKRSSTRVSTVSAKSDSDSEEDVEVSVSMDVTKPITTVIRTKQPATAGEDATQGAVPAAGDHSEDDDVEDDETGADVTVPMDMTKALTGFIQQKQAGVPPSGNDDSASLDDEDESMDVDRDATMQSTMEMTRAIGRITSQGTSSRQIASGSPVKARPEIPQKMASPSPRKAVSSAVTSNQGTPSKFRQSLLGGVESPTYTRSPARRVGGGIPPPGRPSLKGMTTSSFRQSLIGGVESSSYVHSPARRIHGSPSPGPAPTTLPASDSNATPTKPSLAAFSAGLSLSARKRSPSPNTKAAKRAAMTAGRKSLGANLPNGSYLFRPPPSSTAKEHRLARSSIVAAVLPGLRLDDSFASSTATERAEISSLEPYGDEVRGKAGMAESSFNLSDDGAPFYMPLNDFLTHVGVQFHEDMSASRRRPVAPRDGDNSTEGEALKAKGPVGLVRLVKAACGAVPQLEALREACREIKEQVDDGRIRLEEMETAFYSNPPDFVREIMCLSNEDEKKEMEAQFKLQKQAARALAVSDYYGWRMDKEFDTEMVQTLQAYQGRLQCDLQIVEEKRDRLRKELLPTLRARHLDLQRELSVARQRQTEIEECDQDELKSLYASIEEQHEVLEGMRSKLHETEQAHQRVRKRLDENQVKIESTTEMIAKARAVCDQIQGCTRGEAKRLLREIRNLEKLHLVRVVRVSPSSDSSAAGLSMVELILDGWLHIDLALDLHNGGGVRSVTMRSKDGEGDGNDGNGAEKQRGAQNRNSNLVRQLAVQILQDEFERERPNHAVLVLRRISKTLIRHRHLLAEIEHLRCRFPLELLRSAPSTELNELSLRASVLLPRQRSKIIISAVSDLNGSPLNQQATFLANSVKVETVYGPVDALAMSAQILDCLAADPTIGSLSRACLQTVETFDV